MTPITTSELALIRHAPAETGGRICGRRDAGVCCGGLASVSSLAAALAPCSHVATSPALRCRQTAEALFPGRALHQDARLWEQDFGSHEGLSPADLPDLGEMTRARLAALAPPCGESFADMVGRVSPALRDLARRAVAGGPVAVVAHAGTVRAALALALDDVGAALAFEVAPLSVTRLRCLPGAFSVVCVNAVI